MKKISLIIQREYLTRVRKKSFIVMTFLGPILMAAMFVVPIWITTMDKGEQDVIGVVDRENYVADIFEDSESIRYQNLNNTSIDELKKNFKDLEYTAILEIIKKEETEPELNLFSDKQLSDNVGHDISKQIEQELTRRKLLGIGKDESFLDSLRPKVQIETFKIDEHGSETKSSKVPGQVIGFIAAFMIYMFIFIYGAQVMRGVIEEKVSRIVEIIISSVKPFQLMLGKITGIALVVLTQFLLWIILTSAIVAIVPQMIVSDDISPEQIEQMGSFNAMGDQMMQSDNKAVGFIGEILNNDWLTIFSTFIFYFLGGYLLYASLFAAIGSAVDNETETQQFMLPITIPLIVAILLAQPVVDDPGGMLARWLSMIPFTSPVIMMVRIPSGDVQLWEIAVSMTLLVITFLATTWLAGKIYRTGILMYGKKVNYKELWKWLRYSG